MSERIGVYPGSFDPVTNGHLDIIKRGMEIFDHLYVVIPNNIQKKTFFTIQERIDLIKKAILDDPNIDDSRIDVVSTELLTVEFAESVGAYAMLRGLRMVSDFEYEMQLFTTNKIINKKIETIFIMSSHEVSYISSSTVKEIALFGGDISSFVPEVVQKAVADKLIKK